MTMSTRMKDVLDEATPTHGRRATPQNVATSCDSTITARPDLGIHALEVRDIRCSYGHRRRVLCGVNLSVGHGVLVGVAGENGSGVSTLLKILAGELRADSGSVWRGDRFGYCPQTAVLNDALTVDQHVEYFAAAYGLSDKSYAQSLIERLGYSGYRSTRAAMLSGGTKQKLNLTLALMHQPSLLLLDEPYQGFDWETYLRFWDLVTDIKCAGAAVVVISHLIFERARFDRLLNLVGGVLSE
jgi:ABC-2 type transport system ATP-binding protein